MDIEMEAESGGGVESLIPGLPDEVVLLHVLSRLPWYARPVCRAFSKHWRASIDTLATLPYFAAQTRKHQLPLLKGLFIICTTKDPQLFLVRDHTEDDKRKRKTTFHTVREGRIHSHWRKLPPLQGLPRMHGLLLVANYGILFVWSSWVPNIMVKIDLARGDWTWTRLHTFADLYLADLDVALSAISFKGKIFVPLLNAAGSQTEIQKREGLLIYDMMTGQCKHLVKGNFPELRVLLKTSSQSASHVQEELYGLVELESMLVVLVGDADRKCWRKIKEVPYPDDWEWSDLSDGYLLNGNCFEPVIPDMEINIVWWDCVNYHVSWFDPLRKTWVHMLGDNMVQSIEYLMFIHGSLYGVFIEFDDELNSKSCIRNQGMGMGTEDQAGNKGSEVAVEVVTSQQDPIFRKRAILKATICVAERIVKWERVHAIGYFEDDAIVPVDNCTIIT
ncbi:hypothetical protein GOP47_0006694 [Adiantum capillus-veneris]|uniref:F-box domain-containing protein n=1 Tax=Adiantum capillus-veneris TaxID=13818 RepID=A0A9D4V4D0_ADICA|nr:hypothetical protein GOP47_0006694 [Adiantum capillus-veneris]